MLRKLYWALVLLAIDSTTGVPIDFTNQGIATITVGRDGNGSSISDSWSLPGALGAATCRPMGGDQTYVVVSTTNGLEVAILPPSEGLHYAVLLPWRPRGPLACYNWTVFVSVDEWIFAVDVTSQATGNLSATNISARDDGWSNLSFPFLSAMHVSGTSLFVAQNGSNTGLLRMLDLTSRTSFFFIGRTVSTSSDGFAKGTYSVQPQPAASIANPAALASRSGYLYFVEGGASQIVRKVSLNAPFAVSTLAGRRSSGASFVDGMISIATFASVSAIATLSSTELVIADGTLLRLVNLDLGSVTTFAGIFGVGSSDGLAAARVSGYIPQMIDFNDKYSLVVDSNAGTLRQLLPAALFSADPRATFSGFVSRRAINSITSGAASFVSLNFYPWQTFVTDSFSNRIRVVDANRGVLKDLAFPVTCSFGGMTLGSDATSNGAATVVIACARNSLYTVDVSSGNLAWWCGVHDNSGLIDAPCGTARFSSPQDVASAGDLGVVVADSRNNVLRLVSWNRVVQTAVGNGTQGRSDGKVGTSMICNPTAVTMTSRTRDGSKTFVFVESLCGQLHGAVRQWNMDLGIVTTLFEAVSDSGSVDGLYGSISIVTSVASCGDVLLIVDSGSVRQVVSNGFAPGIRTLSNTLLRYGQYVQLSPSGESCQEFSLLDRSFGNITSMRIDDALNTTYEGRSGTLRTWTAPYVNVSLDGSHAFLSTVDTFQITAITGCTGRDVVVVADGMKIRILDDKSAAFTLNLGDFLPDAIGPIRDMVCDGGGTIVIVLPVDHVIVRINGTWSTSQQRSAVEIYGVAGLPGWNAPYLNGPTNVAVGGDSGATAYIAEPLAHRILTIGTIYRGRAVLVGDRFTAGLADGPVATATLNVPSAMAFDLYRQVLYFFDTGILRRFTIGTRIVDTVMGRFDDHSGSDGIHGVGSWANPIAICIGARGHTLVAADNQSLRIVTWSTAGPTVTTKQVIAGGELKGFALLSDGSIVTPSTAASSLLRMAVPENDNVDVLRPLWGQSTCRSYDTSFDRDSKRGYPGYLDAIIGLVPSTDATFLYAVERKGTIRGLYDDGFITTMRGPSSVLNAPKSFASSPRGSILVANFGFNNIVECFPIRGVECQVISGPRSAPYLGGDAVGSGLTAQWVGPIAIVPFGDQLMVFEGDGCRVRTLDPSTFVSSHFSGARTPLCVSVDGPTLTTARLLYPKAAASHPDGRVFFAQLACLRKIQSQIMTTISGLCDSAVLGGAFDGPLAGFTSIQSIAIVADFGYSWLYIVDGSVLRRLDVSDPFLVTRTLYGRYGETRFNLSIGALGSSAIVSSVNSSQVVVAAGCQVFWFNPPEVKRTPKFRKISVITPTYSESVSINATSTPTQSPSETPDLTPTHDPHTTNSTSASHTSSLRNVTQSSSLTVVKNPTLFIDPDRLDQSDLASLGSLPTARKVLILLLGSKFDISNSTVIGNPAASIAFTELTGDPSKAKFVKRLATLFNNAAVVSINSTALVIHFAVDTSYFAYATETIQVSVLPAMLVPKYDPAIGILTLVKNPKGTVLQAKVQKYAALAGAISAAIVGFASVNAASAAQAQRGLLILAMQECSFLVSDPLPWYSHPTGLQFGADATRFHRAAMLLNPAIVLGFIIIHAVVADYVRYYTRKSRRYAMGLVMFPALAMPVFMFFLQPSVTSAIVVAMRDPQLPWQIVGGLMAFGWALAGCAVLLFFLDFGSVFTIFEQETGRKPSRLTFIFFGDGNWSDRTAAGNRYVNHTAMYYLLFSSMRRTREWFIVVEIVVSIASGWGAARIDSGDCRESSLTLTVAELFLFVAVLVLRPYNAPFKTLTMLLLDVATLAASALIAFALFFPSASSSELIFDAGQVANACLVALAVITACESIVLFVNFFWQRALRRARQLQDDAFVLPPRAPLLQFTGYSGTELPSKTEGLVHGIVASPQNQPFVQSIIDVDSDDDHDGFLEEALLVMSQKRQAAQPKPRGKRRRKKAGAQRDKNPLTRRDDRVHTNTEVQRMYDML